MKVAAAKLPAVNRGWAGIIGTYAGIISTIFRARCVEVSLLDVVKSSYLRTNNSTRGACGGGWRGAALGALHFTISIIARYVQTRVEGKTSRIHRGCIHMYSAGRGREGIYLM